MDKERRTSGLRGLLGQSAIVIKIINEGEGNMDLYKQGLNGPS